MRNLYISILVIGILGFAMMAIAQEKSPPIDIGKESIYFPHHYELYKVQVGLGFFMAKLPLDWVETALQAPLIDLHLTFGLPAGFSLEGDLSTVVVSNQVTLGPRWNFIHRNFSFNLGYDLGFSLGMMNIAGFHNTGMMLTHYPNLSVGLENPEAGLYIQRGSCDHRMGANENRRGPYHADKQLFRRCDCRCVPGTKDLPEKDTGDRIQG